MMSKSVRVFVALLVAACEVGSDRPEQEHHFSQSIRNGMGEYTQPDAFELVRAITGFGAGFSTLTDVTHLLPTIRDALQSGSLLAYAFIDTWVGPRTGWETKRSYRKTGAESDQCVMTEEKVLEKTGNGNGYSVSASLYFFEEGKDEQPTAPRSSVSVSSGPLGGAIRTGSIRMIRATVDGGGKYVLFSESMEKPIDFDRATDQTLQVYPCPEARGCDESFLEQSQQNFKWWRELVRAAQTQDSKAAVNQVVETVRNSWKNLLGDVSLIEVEDAGTVKCRYEPWMQLEDGMPVFLNGDDASSVLLVDAADKKVGSITAVDGEGKTFSVTLQSACKLIKPMLESIRLKVPKTPHYKNNAEMLALAFKRDGGQHLRSNSSSMGIASPLDTTSDQIPGFVVMSAEGHLKRLVPVGAVKAPEETDGGAGIQPRLRTGGPPVASFLSSGQSLSDGSSVFVLDIQHTGKLIDRLFDIPVKSDGDRVLVSFAPTGHGWSETDKQCNEFCRIAFRFKINDKEGEPFSPWHGDCSKNPMGPAQHGTWSTSRSSWCPGSVEAGIYLDVSDHAKEGRNRVELYMLVLNANTRKYERYTNIAGYNAHDPATMVVSLTFSVYSTEAVAAILSQPKAYSLAEKALRLGAGAVIGGRVEILQPSQMSFLQKAETEIPLKSTPADLGGRDVLKHRAVEHSNRTPASLVSVSSSKFDYTTGCQTRVGRTEGTWDTLKAQPWFCYNMEKDGDPGDPGDPIDSSKHGVRKLQLFDDRAVNIDNRVVTSSVSCGSLPLQVEYSKVLLYLEVNPPEAHAGRRPNGTEYPHEMDAYDRLFSLGGVLDNTVAPQRSVVDVEQLKYPFVQQSANDREPLHATVHEHSPDADVRPMADADGPQVSVEVDVQFVAP